MTRGDIEAQQCNPDFIGDQCRAIIKEVERARFSLWYIRDQIRSLYVFVESLKDTDRDG